MSQPRKRLRARTLPLKSKRPTCPLHPLVQMEFRPEEARWECQMDGCTQIVFPKAVADNGRPVIGRGEVELFVLDDPSTGNRHYLLRSSGNNVMIDVTDCMVHDDIDVKGGLARFDLGVPIVGG